MKCNQCGKSSTYLDTSCCWMARCDHLGTAEVIGECSRCGGDVTADCDEQEPPAWDCDLAQDSQYCIHHAD